MSTPEDNTGKCLESTNYRYIQRTKAQGQKVHLARFPSELPRFFVFAGSSTTGAFAETLGSRWIGIELNPEYAGNSQLRFVNNPLPCAMGRLTSKNTKTIRLAL